MQAIKRDRKRVRGKRALRHRRATSIVLLVVLGVREDGQKVLLAAKNMGGEIYSVCVRRR